jgi:hypothetical protein
MVVRVGCTVAWDVQQHKLWTCAANLYNAAATPLLNYKVIHSTILQTLPHLLLLFFCCDMFETGSGSFPLLCCCWSTVYWFQAVGLSPCFVTKGCMWVRLCGLHMGCKWQYYFTFSFTWQRSLTFSLATNWKSDFGCPVMQLAWKWCSVIRNGMGPPERVAWTSFTCC